ncbi:GtrA family protein [Microvirga splendida]|uniref:GtrA family protein n=1 Tax=Microvirga splendida TaxID=2795727 RepID=A0ABS0Y6A0_9HYPH|nr:GtrA family protein [Microvirga splendida]MBJ6127843.1 GtrA family protein [Microvirga splendida]
MNDAGRFLGAGLVNTAFTVVIYQVLLFWLSATSAYAGAWLVGLVFVALVYPSHVFKGGRTGSGARVATAIVYLLGFAIGLATVKILDTTFSAEHVAIFGALSITTIFNFVLMRVVLRGWER